MDFLAVWGGRCDRDEDIPCCRSIITKCIGDPSSFTIADAYEESGFVAKEFSLHELGSMGSGSPGSIYIKWIASLNATKHILENLKSGKRPDLLQFGVLQLAVERTIFKVSKVY